MLGVFVNLGLLHLLLNLLNLLWKTQFQASTTLSLTACFILYLEPNDGQPVQTSFLVRRDDMYRHPLAESRRPLKWAKTGQNNGTKPYWTLFTIARPAT